MSRDRRCTKCRATFFTKDNRWPFVCPECRQRELMDPTKRDTSWMQEERAKSKAHAERVWKEASEDHQERENT